MNKILTYKDLLVWQKAMDISVEVYRITGAFFPKEEIFGLTSQVRRAANSISLNIAEGHGTQSTANFLKYLGISLASKNELESGIILAVRLNFIKEDECKLLFDMLLEESKMLHVIIQKLKNKNSIPNP